MSASGGSRGATTSRICAPLRTGSSPPSTIRDTISCSRRTRSRTRSKTRLRESSASPATTDRLPPSSSPASPRRWSIPLPPCSAEWPSRSASGATALSTCWSFVKRRTAMCRPIPRSVSCLRARPLHASPRKDENTESRSASLPSDRANSIRRSCRNARRFSPCGSPTARQ